jgi:hypothetical protein
MCGVSKHSIQALTEGSNTTHLYVAIDNMEWLVDPSVHSYARWKDPKSLAQVLKDRNDERERGGSEWEPIKIILEGDRCSNKMNMTSNTRLRLNYPSWSRPRRHWSDTDPRNKQTTFRAKTNEHTQRELARFAA